MKGDLTQGSVLKNLIRFSLPYLLSCFLQSFYGLADIFITGRYNGADAITAVSIGSQVTHMLTVVIVGLAMGSTVCISRCVGGGNKKEAAKNIGNTIILFSVFSVMLMVLLLLFLDNILNILSTPKEAFTQAGQYLAVCFIGVPFIMAYNVISSIYRGLGDSKSPMYFVGIAGVFNVLLDIVLIGHYGMGAKGAALATVISQALSVFMALIFLKKLLNKDINFGIGDLKISKKIMGSILKIGMPISLQDGFVQVAFLTITVIANKRGVDAAAAVGIVEKLISFMFLVPSAMLSTVSAISAQNAGAGQHNKSRQALWYGTGITVLVGMFFVAICLIFTKEIIELFAKNDAAVVVMGVQYLRSYVFDCVFAGIHFCFSGFFCAYKKSSLSFIHNIVSILTVRIPGAYMFSKMYPDTLFPMGMAAPLGSLLSSFICIGFYIYIRKVKHGFEN